MTGQQRKNRKTKTRNDRSGDPDNCNEDPAKKKRDKIPEADGGLRKKKTNRE